MIQWLKLLASTAGGAVSIPGWGSKIPIATCSAKKKKKKAFGELVEQELWMFLK